MTFDEIGFPRRPGSKTFSSVSAGVARRRIAIKKAPA